MHVLVLLLILPLILGGCGGKSRQTQMEKLASSLPSNLPEDSFRTGYEIFVYSFSDSDGDGIGDLDGILNRLDYIADLGFTEIWTTPVFPSPTYHKYDTADYLSVDPQFGTMEDFEKLLQACHERGIRWILDLAVNHTSTEHPWFQAARDYLKELPADWEPSVDYCPYFDYYNFSREPKDGYVPLEGTNWYYEARFWDGMPDLNLSSDAVRDEIRQVVQFWLDKGVDGFRLDALTSYYTEDTNASIGFTGWLSDTVHGLRGDAYLVGEVWADQQTYAKYYASGIDSLFDFQFAGQDGIIAQTVRGSRPASKFAEDLAAEEALYTENGPQAINAPFYTNHDMARGTGYYAYDDGSRTKLALGLHLLMTGNAFVYYGEELGMKGSGKDENKRAPMLWSSEEKTADTCVGPPEMDSFEQKFEGAKEQQQDPYSILNYVRTAVRLRNAFPEIARENTVPVPSMSSDTVCAFTRGSLLIVINISEDSATVPVSEKSGNLVAVLLTSEEEVRLKNAELTIPSFGIAVLQSKE